ncbi:uncharacterized protein LOC108095603 [Drosophila ficusphila]|uniref:uncharacterized protein LOC108095603 n=1 Tax=Drosophila ficusphila TaxID=30025 RepID=UPI0007E5BCDA|nr:uncharacterized protein LOC108095603 [Drosophila ficusphila]
MKKSTKKNKQENLVFHRDCIADSDNSLYSDDSEEEEEATEEQSSAIREISWEDLKREMGEMNRTLDDMQMRLAIDPYGRDLNLERERDAEMGLEPEDTRWMILHGSKDPPVRELQLNNLRIRRQLDALIRCSELGSGRLLALDRLFTRQRETLVERRKEHEQVLSFHLTKQLEAGKCLQRYRYARDLYASWRELFNMGRHLKEAFKKYLARSQSRMQYRDLKKRALEEIAAAHETCLGSSKALISRVRELEMGLAPLGFYRPSVGSRLLGSVVSAGVATAEMHRMEERPGRPVIVMANRWQRRSLRTVKFTRGDLLTIPVAVPPVESTWYGKMQNMLLHPPKLF